MTAATGIPWIESITLSEGYNSMIACMQHVQSIDSKVHKLLHMARGMLHARGIQPRSAMHMARVVSSYRKQFRVKPRVMRLL